MFQSVFMAVASAGDSNGIGSIFKVGAEVSKIPWGTVLARMGAHALAQGLFSTVQGGNFLSGALAGAFSSVSGDLLGHAIKFSRASSIIRSNGFAMLTGAVSGGVGSVIGGGNFWMGAGQGLIVTVFNHLMHSSDVNDEGPRKPIGSKRVRSTDQKHSLKGSRGGQSVITQENPGNQVGNGKGIFVPSGSQSMVTADMTYYDDGTVDINMTMQVARMNTTGSYIANYDIVGSNGKIISSGILLDKGLGINSRMDYPIYTQKGSAAVISTATLRSIPLNSMIRINVGLTYQIPMGARGVMRTNHIIKVR